MPSPDDGATTPAASPASTTSRPLSHRSRGFRGIGAPSLRMVSQSSSPEAARSAAVARLRSTSRTIDPMPTLADFPWGKTQP